MSSSLETALGQLHAAFPAKPLDASRAFSEWGTTYTSSDAFKEGVRGRTWLDLPSAFLEWHHDAPMFLGPSSLPDYLPAYLAAVLRDDPVLSAMPSFLLGILTRDDASRFDARFAQFSSTQKQAISAALTALESKWKDTRRSIDVRRALDSYWRNNF